MKRHQMGSASEPLPEKTELVIIGGGIMGLSVAHEVARLRTKSKRPASVVVLERSYLVAGASGRNGGGIRMQWADAQNVGLMMRSVEICRGLAQELDINLWFRQGGYLFLARDEAGQRRLERNAEIHAEVGAPTRLLSPRESLDIVPELDVSQVRIASFNPDDGVVFPWPFVWGYAARARALGARIRTHTGVSRIEPLNEGGYRLHLSTGEEIIAERVVNATGAWSIELNSSLGIDLPNHPHRHEILSSEPLKPFLDPLVVDLSSGLYFSQSTRGEIVTGITMADPDGVPAAEEVSLESSVRFLAHLSRALIRVLPCAQSLKPLRQWSGPYDLSPDGHPMVGPSPGHEGIIQLCGFTGHGFMMAPVVGEIVGAWLANDDKHQVLAHWDPCRFAEGRAHEREDMIIG
jgi:sarcosine oxidase subunit beta